MAASAICAAIAIAGCSDEPTADNAAGEASTQPIVKTVDRGPVQLTVTADRDTISIAERLGVAIEVRADDGIEVQMPDFGESLNEFQIRDYQAPPPVRDGDTWIYRATYDLDIFLSGTYTIPAITARYRDRRSSDGASEPQDEHEPQDEPEPAAELSTEPFTIEVASLLEGEFDPQNFRDVKPVATLEAEQDWGFVLWGGGGVCAVIAVAAVAMFVRRRRPQAAVIPPHEWAFQELQRLADEQLVEAGRIKTFYYRLNEITRTYIELRFALMAPERTTEEFLQEMRSSNALPPQHQPALGAFLEACDLVKYTRYQPEVAEIEQVFNAARDFVAATRPAGRAKEAAA